MWGKGNSGKRFGALLVAAAILLLAVQPAAAVPRIKKLWAGRFGPVNNSQPSIQWHELGVEPGGSDCWFFANVTLPAGSKLEKIQYVHKGTGPTSTMVALETSFFRKWGQAEWISASSVDQSGEKILVEGSTFEFGNRPLKLREKVFIYVYIENSNATVHGVKLFFDDGK